MKLSAQSTTQATKILVKNDFCYITNNFTIGGFCILILWYQWKNDLKSWANRFIKIDIFYVIVHSAYKLFAVSKNFFFITTVQWMAFVEIVLLFLNKKDTHKLVFKEETYTRVLFDFWCYLWCPSSLEHFKKWPNTIFGNIMLNNFWHMMLGLIA